MAKTKEEKAEYMRKYRAENPEKVKATRVKRAKYRAENAEWSAFFAEKERARRAKNITELKDVYVEETLRRQGFPKESITPELIELKRITLKTTRLCRQLKN